ncbi:MAG: amidohydrolase family protein [Planctomycetes bacterium]|nr:amidohydrolase family protein [Planctomycetota bacterium]
MWRETTKHDRNLRIFREELDDFLPETIVDAHVHLIGPGVIPDGRTFSCAGHPIATYTIEDLEQDLAELYPGRKTLGFCFGLPHAGYDRRRNDDYVARVCDSARFFALRLFDPTRDTPRDGPGSLRADLASGRFIGIKPYPDYVRKPDVNDVEIREMLPDWAMEIVAERRQIVMLHIPRRARLADPLNRRQIIDLCERHPDARIILAHIGRAYFLKNIAGNLEPLAHLPNLYVDLAMLNHPGVLEHCFRVMDPRRILYGTDIPIALAPGKSVEINGQYTYVTPVPWDLSIHDPRGKIVFTSFLYEELRAIRRAAERLSLPRDSVEGLFSRNALSLILSAGGAGGCGG